MKVSGLGEALLPCEDNSIFTRYTKNDAYYLGIILLNIFYLEQLLLSTLLKLEFIFKIKEVEYDLKEGSFDFISILFP